MNDLTTKIVLVVAVALACFGVGWFAHQPAPPTTVTKFVQAQAAKAETTLVHDTVRLTQYLTHYDTTRDTVLAHLTDTVRVRAFVFTADSTITACQTALGSCTKALDAQKLVVGIQQAQAPSRLQQILTNLGSAALGYGAGRLVR